MLNIITSKKSIIKDRLSYENKNKETRTVKFIRGKIKKEKIITSLEWEEIRRVEIKVRLYWTISSQI